MKEEKEERKYQKGQFIGIGIAIGLPLGIPIGLAFGNIAVGLPFGLFLGVILGVIWERFGTKDPIELTEEQKKQQRIFTWLGILIGVLFLISVITIFVAKLGNG